MLFHLSIANHIRFCNSLLEEPLACSACVRSYAASFFNHVRIGQLAKGGGCVLHMRAWQQSACLLNPMMSPKDSKHNVRSMTCDSPLLQVITSGCATYEPWASALGGIVGGLLVLPGSLFVLHVLKVDDPVDAVTVCCIGIIVHAQHVCFSCLDCHLELHMLQVCNSKTSLQCRNAILLSPGGSEFRLS